MHVGAQEVGRGFPTQKQVLGGREDITQRSPKNIGGWCGAEQVK